MDRAECSINYGSGKDFEEFGLESEAESCFSSRFSTRSKLSTNKLKLIEKIRDANLACQKGEYRDAIKLYTETINMDPVLSSNHILYSNRSAAYCGAKKYAKALQDAIKARELNPTYSKAYYRQGIALVRLGKHIDALAAFASGLAEDKDSPQLLTRFIETALQCPLKEEIEPVYRQLQILQSDKNPFLVISVIGQKVLDSGNYPAGTIILESALRINTRSLKLRAFVYSALGCGYWALGESDKAIHCMQQDLEVVKSFGDITEECRVHANLGAAHFCRGSFNEALVSLGYQYVLAKKANQTEQAAEALSALGHVYWANDDLQNALASHNQCLQVVRKLNKPNVETREVGNVGSIYLAMKKFNEAIECEKEHLKLAISCGNKLEEAKAYSTLGSAYQAKKEYDSAIQYNQQLLRLAQEMEDKNIEARAYRGFGHAARCLGDLHQAKRYHHLELEMVLISKDRLGESRALSNLGLIHYLMADFDGALKLHRESLKISRQFNDVAGMRRAFGNISKCYSAINNFEEAVKYQQQEMSIVDKPLPMTEEDLEMTEKLKLLDLNVDDEPFSELNHTDNQFIPLTNILPQPNQ